MEFEGIIKKILPTRSGTNARTGNEWTAMPFVFEYFENPTDRYADSVVLETFDTEKQAKLKEAWKLTEGGMEARCGWGHKADEYNGRYYNNLRLYSLEILKVGISNTETTTTEAAPSEAAAPANDKKKEDAADDLPF